jgi:predicted GNAT family acetyltransferase
MRYDPCVSAASVGVIPALAELYAVMISRVDTGDLERVRSFLERHIETSMFLLSNLAIFGPRLGESWLSGNYHLVEERGRIVAVFCLTRRGNLLIQAGGRTDLAESILETCESEPIEVCGVVGEWSIAAALWDLLLADPRFEPNQGSKDMLYSVSLAQVMGTPAETPAGVTVQTLDPGDFEQWEKLNTAYLAELHMPLPVSDAAHEAEFARRTRTRWWWGAFVGPELAATVALNAAYGSVGQVGGVYTRPADRKKGLARAAMWQLMQQCRAQHRFEKLILFTGVDNHAARRLYESLGFEAVGEFGLLFGSRRSQARPPLRHKWPGLSGELYTYDVYAWPARLSPSSGNFIFANSLGGGHWRPLSIGESADLATLADHERLRNSNRWQPPSHVHVRLNFNPAAVRRREVNDLTARWMSDEHGKHHEPGS